jgi:hypothetical protein
VSVRDALERAGLPSGDLHGLPTSVKRFPDGAQYRVEIPSTEGPRCLEAILEEAARLDVPIHRVSQGSGIFMLTDDELDELVALAAGARVELSLFARAGFTASVAGQDALAALLDDVARAAAHGVRSVLLADIGAVHAFARLRADGVLPPDMQAKVSVLLPVANAATAHVLEELGASTLNLPPDLSLAQIAAIRAAVDLPIDFYVEAPDTLGGSVRLHEIPELIRVAAPVYVKFGLRNAPDVYPSGSHLEATSVALSRERVRRARLGLELLERSGYEAERSNVGAAGLAVPVVAVPSGTART